MTGATATRATIQELEDRLTAAMRTGETRTLEELLADDLLFTNHEGRRLSKQEDLAAHRSGLLKVAALDVLDRQIKIIAPHAVVAVRVRLAGSYGGAPFSGEFAYTRVWCRREGRWSVVAAHCCAAT